MGKKKSVGMAFRVTVVVLSICLLTQAAPVAKPTQAALAPDAKPAESVLHDKPADRGEVKPARSGPAHSGVEMQLASARASMKKSMQEETQVSVFVQGVLKKLDHIDHLAAQKDQNTTPLLEQLDAQIQVKGIKIEKAQQASVGHADTAADELHKYIAKSAAAKAEATLDAQNAKQQRKVLVDMQNVAEEEERLMKIVRKTKTTKVNQLGEVLAVKPDSAKNFEAELRSLFQEDRTSIEAYMTGEQEVVHMGSQA